MKYVNWYIEGRIIHITPPCTYTLEDARNIDAAVTELLDAGQSPVHVIEDQSDMEYQFNFREDFTFQCASHANIGWFVMINKTDVVKRMVASIVGHKMKFRNRFVSSFEEACTFLRTVDDSLTELL